MKDRLQAFSKKSLSLFLALVMMFSILPIGSMVVDAATPGSQRGFSLKNYLQVDSSWSNKVYGKGSIKNTGCGILSTVNAVYNVTGNFINPETLASWAHKNGYYNKTGSEGSYAGLFTKCDDKFGDEYNFKVVGSGTGNVKSAKLVNHLKDGGTAVVHVPGHFMAIVDYNKDNGKYLVFDCAPGSGTSYNSIKRRNLTSPKGDWKTADQLSQGNLKIDRFYLFSSTKKSYTITANEANSITNSSAKLAKFEVVSKLEDVNTSIKVDYSQDDTSNYAGEDVKFICNDIDILLNHIPIVTDLTLKSKPDKTTYELFEEFDNTGMLIEATKDDGSVETITDYTVAGFETNSVGTKTVTISYEGKSVSFDIEVAHTHTWGEWEIVSSPNCLDKGSEKRVCSVCKEIEMRDVDPLGHNWEKDFTVDIEPKCEIAGSKSIHCSRCDVVKDITPIDPIGHDYESSITKAVTCTENGIKTFVCKNDPSHTHTEEIPKLGHNYVASITKQPTCEEKGIKTFVCSNDSSHTYTEDIPAIGHSFELTKTIKPTCTEDGKEIYTCKNDSFHTKEVILKATGHTPSDWIIDKKPTYLEDGSRHRECTVCKTVLTTETISMLDDITAPEIEIKVKDNSFKSFINNISFGLFFKDTVDVNITAQDAESGVEKIEYIKTNTPISESDIVLQTEWISEEKLTVSDDEEFIIYVKATDKQGNISYAGTDGMVVDKTAPVINGITNNAVYCQPVSFTVSDKYIEKVIVNGTEALTDSGEYTLPLADLQYNIVAVDKAGNETVYNVTVNDGHTYGDWVIDKSADCTNKGEKHRACSICGYRDDAEIFVCQKRMGISRKAIP